VAKSLILWLTVIDLARSFWIRFGSQTLRGFTDPG
jgi:hypothetical protein